MCRGGERNERSVGLVVSSDTLEKGALAATPDGAHDLRRTEAPKIGKGPTGEPCETSIVMPRHAHSLRTAPGRRPEQSCYAIDLTRRLDTRTSPP